MKNDVAVSKLDDATDVEADELDATFGAANPPQNIWHRINEANKAIVAAVAAVAVLAIQFGAGDAALWANISTAVIVEADAEDIWRELRRLQRGLSR
jgi:hypothetical protein